MKKNVSQWIIQNIDKFEDREEFIQVALTKHPNKTRKKITRLMWDLYNKKKISDKFITKTKFGTFIKKTDNKNLDSEKLIKTLKKEGLTIPEIAERFKVDEETVGKELKEFFGSSIMIDEKNGTYSIKNEPEQGRKHQLNPDMWRGDKLIFGFVSDNHMCNVHSREDVLNCLYDIYAGENISKVYNTGNWIDGEHRFNKNELFIFGCTKQIRYCAENYPFREGITTDFIAGDDHEGWFVQREGIDVGDYLQTEREKLGRFDMKYLGYGEADIELTEGGFEYESWMRVCHPGGGTGYATSYALQRLVESYQAGEKPRVVLAGHYHKMDHSYPREVHCVQTGCTCDQTLFMRKKKIQAMVGGGIVELNRAKDGIINRCKVEYITFYDKKFYKGKDRYWK